MDFGLTEMESLVGQHQQGGSSDQNGKRKLSGSGSGSSGEDEISRASIHTRNGHDLGLSKQKSLLRSTGSCDGGFGGSQQPQMLSFSSPSSDGGGGGGGGSLPVSYYQNPPAPVYHRNAGYASGTMQGSFTGIRGPFTPAQWIELEHQALIYKYLTANVPVPPTLLVPIRRAFISTSLSGFAPQSYGWAPFHLGYPTSTDPEPGRCRRTDGKKWRCSRDAVPDQKYCERHINRGRHRSRKPVEVQTGQAASSGPANPKVGPISSAMSSPATTGGSLSNNTLAIKNLQAGVPNLVTNTVVNRFQGSQGLSMMTTSKDSTFAVPKQVTYETSPHESFGFVPSESLVNPPSKASYLNCKSYNSFSDINDQQSQNPHITDNWKKDESFPNHSTISWPEEGKPDWTQLSMSTTPSSSFSNQEKEAGPKNSMWVPLSWGNSMGSGGCLEEIVLNSAVGNEGWDSSPSFSSSPTDVLQKGASVSLSNSGSGDENKVTTLEESNLGDDDLLCSAHVASSF